MLPKHCYAFATILYLFTFVIMQFLEYSRWLLECYRMLPGCYAVARVFWDNALLSGC